MAQPHAHHMRYRPEIDGLRAVAVMSVVLHHSGLAPFFGGGFVGVDIFFVISGYLITSIISNDVAARRFTFRSFYERRIRRIFPALFLVLLVSTIAALAILTPRQLKDFGQSLIATATFTSNIYFPLKIGYFAQDAANIPLLHTWSLSVEEQFYVVFPAVLLLAARFRTRSATACLLAAAAAASLLGAVALQPHHAVAMFFWTTTRAWELLAGALLALHSRRSATFFERSAGLRSVAEITGALLILGSLALVRETMPWPGAAALPVVAGSVLLLAASRSDTPVGRVLASPPFVTVGLISYSVYLWHQPLFAFARVAAGRPLSPAETCTLVAASLAAGWLSWRFVEMPVRAGKRVPPRTVFGAAAAATAAMLAIGGVFHAGQGLPQRYDAETRALAATMTHSPFRDTCHTDGANFIGVERACRYFGSDMRWAVLADSEGVELAAALAERVRSRGEGVLHLTFSSCPAALTYEHPAPGCNAWTRQSVEWLERHPEVEHVLIVYRYSYHLFGDQLKTFPQMPDERPAFLPDLPPEAARERFWRSFSTLVARLRRANKHVIVVRPIPDLPVSVDRYVFGGSARAASTGMTRAQADARNAWTNARLDTLADVPGVTLIDPRRTMCDKARCRSIAGHEALYFDDNHVSMAGARRILDDAQRDGLIRFAGRPGAMMQKTSAFGER